MKGYHSIYFIQAASGPIKIGIAADPVKRLAGLQSGHHEQLSLICAIEGDRELEAQLHRRFARGHIRGEWFAPDTPGLSGLIVSLIEGVIPGWIIGERSEEVLPVRICACGWPLEAELAERGGDVCWTCLKEAAAQ